MADAHQAALLDVDGAANYLNVSRSWLYSNAERLPTLRCGRQLRWRRVDLDEWLEASRRSA
jgi:excisionase family DNA binding protein